MAGRAEPRLPDFLLLVEAITARVSDLVEQLVPISEVPSLLAMHERRMAAKRVAFDDPWSEAVLRVVETEHYRSHPSHRDGVIAQRLGISEQQERESLGRLEAAGILSLQDGRYVDVNAFTVDMTAPPEQLQRLKAHWTSACLQRLDAPHPDDWLGYNVFSISESDLEQVREVLRYAFREIRTITAASSPIQTVALLNMQLISWPEQK